MLVVLALAGACFAAPKVDETIDDGASTGIELGGSDGAPYQPTSSTTAAAEDDGTSGALDTGGEVTADGSSTGEAEVDTGSDTTGSGWNEDDVPPGFPGTEPFGDDVRELDLVGTWTTPWAPTGVADVELVIDDDGSFVWRERAADCSDVGSASGTMWVSNGQLVMHFDAWDKRAPWDTEDALGIAIAPPYRLRIGYTPMGGYLGLSAPAGLLAIDDWSGRGYVRISVGVGALSDWAAEAELWAMPDGEPGPLLVARDRFEAHLGSSGVAQLLHARTWWYPEQSAAPDDSEVGPWSDDTPGNTAGAATVVGVGHAYDAGGLLTFTPSRSFKLGVASDCE